MAIDILNDSSSASLEKLQEKNTAAIEKIRIKSLIEKFTKNKLMKSYLYSSMSGQVQIKFLSPWALSTLPTVGQYL